VIEDWVGVAVGSGVGDSVAVGTSVAVGVCMSAGVELGSSAVTDPDPDVSVGISRVAAVRGTLSTRHAIAGKANSTSRNIRKYADFFVFMAVILSSSNVLFIESSMAVHNYYR
jgi:hypothetical protein